MGLGGILGFTSLADGVDRAYAGLEGGDMGAPLVAQGAIPDAGSARFLQRMQLEDEVNTASTVHGKAAGHRVLAAARSSARPRSSSMGPSSASSSAGRTAPVAARQASPGPPAIPV